MVRLVFRPYTQVRRTICTSVSLRASTRVSSGFALLRHSSPSFGSQQVCSHSNPSHKLKVGRQCTPANRGSRQSASLRLTGFQTRRLAHMLDSLVRVSRRAEWKARQPAPRACRCTTARHMGARFVPRPPQWRNNGRCSVHACANATACASSHLESSGGPV
jgi:hypothetical protein